MIIFVKNGKTMRYRVLAVIVAMMAFCVASRAQLVYSSDYKGEADVKVYVTEFKGEADLIVYKTKFKGEATGNKGIWFFTEFKGEAKKKIYFTEFKGEADIIIYFTEFKGEAGWKKKSKQQHMY